MLKQPHRALLNVNIVAVNISCGSNRFRHIIGGLTDNVGYDRNVVVVDRLQLAEQNYKVIV